VQKLKRNFRALRAEHEAVIRIDALAEIEVDDL
jgi:hypothetical protein